MFEELHILHPDQLYPEKSGLYLRTFNIARLASEKFKTSIFGIHENIEYDDYVDGIRMIQEKKYKNRIQKYIHFSKGLLSKNYSPMLSSKGLHNIDQENIVFQIEGPYIYNLLKKENIGKYILDEHNVYWELLKFPSFDLKYKIYNKIVFKRDKLIEIKAIENASHILTCSLEDKQKIIDEIPSSVDKITVIPNCVNLNEYNHYMKKEPNKTDKFKVLFVGLLNYAPNTDAVYNICKKIAPNFDDQVQFIIIGKNPPNIKKPDNVKFLGYVDKIERYILDSDVCITPLRYGSGTRFKILEYMAMKKPVISTEKGAEGIDYTNYKNIIIENNIDHFADRIKELLDNDKEGKIIGKNAVNLIKQKYDWKIYKTTLHNVYEDVINANK